MLWMMFERTAQNAELGFACIVKWQLEFWGAIEGYDTQQDTTFEDALAKEWLVEGISCNSLITSMGFISAE